MSYTVLARKYRSRDFDEIVGQDAIATTLQNAIRTGRIHHAYLFAGTRGVGKTSMARILAKALNCMSTEEPTPNPCGECEACLRIAEGEDVDVVEIDAASNTGVDNIRDLRANVNYRPARARHKIYIIDEVHMLSTGAFNALLKTLEEPPSHVKFIFATTEPQKVPATILSRVQRFEFRSISEDRIAGQLRKILDAEGMKADDTVMRRVVRQANGSMRDALSLLDQLLSLGAEKLTPELIDEVLPANYDEDLARVIDAIAEGDASCALAVLDEVLAKGYTLERSCEGLIDQLRSLMLLRICGEETSLVDVPLGVRDKVVAQASRFEPNQYVYMISLIEELRRSIRYNGAARALADAGVVRLAQVTRFRNIDRLLEQLTVAPAQERPSGNRGAAKKKDETGRSTIAESKRVTPSSEGPVRGSGPMRVSGAQAAAARSEPTVQYAVELFDGVLSNVEQLEPDVPSTGDEPAGA